MSTVKDLKELLNTLPDDTEIYCVQDEVFSNGDRAPDYFLAEIEKGNCFTMQDGILYIGDIEP